MAEAALFTIATKILSTVAPPPFDKAYERACSVKNAREELDELKSSIATIQAVLLDAEKKQDDSAAVKEWIKGVKDVLYDADDLFDEVATDDLLRRPVKGSNQLVKKQKGVWNIAKCSAQQFAQPAHSKGYRSSCSIVVVGGYSTPHHPASSFDVEIVALESLTCLQRLQIHSCIRLKKVVLPPIHLNNLEYLLLFDCPQTHSSNDRNSVFREAPGCLLRRQQLGQLQMVVVQPYPLKPRSSKGALCSEQSFDLEDAPACSLQ